MPICTAEIDRLRAEFGPDCTVRYASEAGIVVGRTPEQRGWKSASVAEMHFRFDDPPEVALQRIVALEAIRKLSKRRS